MDGVHHLNLLLACVLTTNFDQCAGHLSFEAIIDDGNLHPMDRMRNQVFRSSTPNF